MWGRRVGVRGADPKKPDCRLGRFVPSRRESITSALPHIAARQPLYSPCTKIPTVVIFSVSTSQSILGRPFPKPECCDEASAVICPTARVSPSRCSPICTRTGITRSPVPKLRPESTRIQTQSGLLSRLKQRDLVRHRGEYWAITTDLNRVRNAYELHATTERLNEEDEGIDPGEWDAVAPDEPHLSERDE